ncbi:hypothetical protein ACFFSW_25430 [Saccharothrix longispora]|uniref:Uncharacterized protein n=1 Tax=Saccharothrix longispora TaxID=33920 RepID=A0ABU1PQM3_9PSEU|nr:hypothetical protein [Saccharothrix longispora]MDR6592543.1 hypothetical protein [Saccharothrix longispora]
MIVSLIYGVTRKSLSVPSVMLRREAATDTELLVLRRENAVSRRQLTVGSGTPMHEALAAVPAARSHAAVRRARHRVVTAMRTRCPRRSADYERPALTALGRGTNETPTARRASTSKGSGPVVRTTGHRHGPAPRARSSWRT